MNFRTLKMIPPRSVETSSTHHPVTQCHSPEEQITPLNFKAKAKKLAKRGKEIPLKSWTGHEGSRRLRLPDFKIIGT